VHTLQVDLCKGINLTYTHKTYLGSFVEAGVYDFNISFVDYPDLNFVSGFNILKDKHEGINDKGDQFITRFIEKQLSTEKIIRLENGFHTTEREKKDFDEQKDNDDKATEEQVRKMLKLAGPTVGLPSENDVYAKSKEGKAELELQIKKEQKSNLRKNAGNNALTAKKNPEAVKCYTEAIDAWPENHVLYGNRSLAYYLSNEPKLSLADADKAIEMNADFVKGHFRRGVALLELKRYAEAVVSLTNAHDLSPKDEEISLALNKAKAIL